MDLEPRQAVFYLAMDLAGMPREAWIAFGGRMQVGKTTAADHLVADHGFEKDALAAPIKSIAAGSFGWDGRKDARGRRLLQELGTAGRSYHAEIWLERLADRILARRPPRLVVDDLRLAREAAWLRRVGFICVRITRPSERICVRAEGAPGHETEVELDEVELDFEIANDAGFDDLFARIDSLLASLWGRGEVTRGPVADPAGSGPEEWPSNRKAPPWGRGLR